MIAAFAASSLFLITYLIHHAQVGSVPFHGAGWLRPVYFGLLVPHIVLAALVVPLALTTIHSAWGGRFDRHRRAGACDAAHLALRLGQRRPRVHPPLPLRSLSPSHRLSTGCFARLAPLPGHPTALRLGATTRPGRHAGKVGCCDDDEGDRAVVYLRGADPLGLRAHRAGLPRQRLPALKQERWK